MKSRKCSTIPARVYILAIDTTAAVVQDRGMRDTRATDALPGRDVAVTVEDLAALRGHALALSSQKERNMLSALTILADASDCVCGEITMLEARDYLRNIARIKALESAAAILDRAYAHVEREIL